MIRVYVRSRELRTSLSGSVPRRPPRGICRRRKPVTNLPSLLSLIASSLQPPSLEVDGSPFIIPRDSVMTHILYPKTKPEKVGKTGRDGLPNVAETNQLNWQRKHKDENFRNEIRPSIHVTLYIYIKLYDVYDYVFWEIFYFSFVRSLKNSFNIK